MSKSVAIWLVAVTAVSSQVMGWTTPIDLSAQSQGSLEVSTPRVARDSSGNIEVVWLKKASPWQIYHRARTGGAWGATTLLNSVFGVRPDVCVTPAGVVFAVWCQQNPSGQLYDLAYRTRTGGTWSAVSFIATTSTLVEDEPRLMADSTGVVHIVYTSGGVESGSGNIMYRTYNGSWSAETNLGSADNTYYGRPDISIDSSNNVHVLWGAKSGTNYQIQYRKKTGGTWGGTVVLASGGTTTVFYAYPRLAAINSGTVKVVAAWHDDATGGISQLEWNSSGDGGTTWGSAAALVNGHYPAMDGRNGTAYLAYEVLPAATGVAYMTWNGTSWSGATTVTPASSRWKGWTDVTEDSNGNVHFVYDDQVDPDAHHQISYVTNQVDTTPPANVTAFTVTASDTTTHLSWTNPADADFSGTMIRYKTTGFPTGPTDGTLLIDQANTPSSPGSADHVALTNGTTYYYAAYAHDVIPNYATGATGSGTPQPLPRPNKLVNGYMNTFTSGLADNWTAYRVNDPNNVIQWQIDQSNYVSAQGQAIPKIDNAALPASGLSAAGVYQVVSGLTVGKIYEFVGYQDVYNTSFAAAGQRYLLNFGINTSGGTTPGSATTDGTIGGCKWMTASQALWNNMGGSPVFFSGFHRSTAAFAATATSVSVWTGVTIDNAAAKDAAATRFSADQCYLFEWDFPANAGLQNGNFEGTVTDLQDGGDMMPASWLPAGGGTGFYQMYLTDSTAAHAGALGFRLLNRRGTCSGGLMQKIACTSGTTQNFSAWVQASGQDSTVAAIGIDPAGGGDISNAGIVWVTSNASTWTQLNVSATASASAITVFLKTSNTNAATSNYHYSYFDDCTYSQTGALGTIAGTIVDECGAAISGAAVSTTTGGYSTTTAANGAYTLSNVVPATYTVQAAKSGFNTASTSGVAVTGGSTTTVNMTLVASAKGTISGTITDNCGAAVSGATVSTTTGCYSTTTAANGTYTLANVPAGNYTVQASKAGYNTASQGSVIVTGGSTTTVNLTLNPSQVGTISGTVTDNCGGAVSGAAVSTTTGCYSTTTAANGTYTLSGVAAATYTVQAVKSGFNTASLANVTVTNGATTTVNLTLQPSQTGTISGTITDNCGVAVSGATVSTTTGCYSTSTAANGTYTLSSVPVGTYTVQAVKSGYVTASQSSVSVTNGGTTTVNLTLNPSQTGTISGTVTASGGGAISGAAVSTSPGCYSTTTNASGQYTLSGVAVGTYSVTASKSGYTPSTQNGVVVSNGGTTTVNFTLSSNPIERVVFGNMEGGFWDTGWGGGSKIPNGWQGWFNPGDFNCFDELNIKHGGAHSAKTTIAAGGNSAGGGFKRGIIQNITMTPNASFTFTVWARHTNGNCPSIMCWNPDGDTDPEHAYAAGRYQWVTTDNWGQLNTWVTRSMTGTGPASGDVTIIVGGAHHGGGGQGVVYIDDVSFMAP